MINFTKRRKKYKRVITVSRFRIPEEELFSFAGRFQMACRNEGVTVSVLPGFNKQGRRENFDRIDIGPGDVISIVGPTGSGKTAFINDIEVFAQGDTVTGRRILVDGEEPDESMIRDPANKPIAMITQNTKCLADTTVRDFLERHRTTRRNLADGVVDDAIALGNRFTGEKFDGDWRITDLSGGQTRSLMIADALLISASPIILLDEIENAGIYKEEVIETLKEMDKAVILVTHDPYVAMIADRRIVMRNGEVVDMLASDGSEDAAIRLVQELDGRLSELRERIRGGETIAEESL